MAARFIQSHRVLSLLKPHFSNPQRILHSTSHISPISRVTQFQYHTTPIVMADHVSTYTSNGENGDTGSTDGELNAWKHRPPYSVHDNDPSFHARYEGSCHCGRVTYQLSREKPLDAKYCHCTTCQKIHGQCLLPSSCHKPASINGLLSSPQRHGGYLLISYPFRRSIPMVRHFPQDRHQLHQRPSRPRLVRII